MTKTLGMLTALTGLLLAPSGARAHEILRHCAPLDWRAEDAQWVRDVAPHNHIDDLIDESPAAAFDVVVDYRKCVEPADLGALSAAAPSAAVSLVGRYLSFVALRHVARADLARLAALPGVGRIEMQAGFAHDLDVSGPAIKVVPGFYSPATVRDWSPSTDGTGVVIAIVDSGVDDPGGVPPWHTAFSPSIGGYDAFTGSYGNPDDDFVHGTWVASVALGMATSGTAEGVAPGAALVDVKVTNASSMCDTPGLWENVAEGLQVIYDNAVAWGVKVINISLGQCDASGSRVESDGTDAISRLVDLSWSLGMTVVASGGNEGPSNTFLATPAAATRAISVAASDDQGSQNRVDDTIDSGSSRGPRSSPPGVATDEEDLKPEVAAPGTNIAGALFNDPFGSFEQSGTSIAAPHVTGLAALFLQIAPDVNPASLKDQIIRTAEARAGPSNVGLDFYWNDRWGWGLVDGYRVVSDPVFMNPMRGDLKFAGPAPAQSWFSPAISVSSLFATPGEEVSVTVQVTNAGPSPTGRWRLHLAVQEFDGTAATYLPAGTRILDGLSVGETLAVPFTYTPQTSGALCYQAEIGYGLDNDFGNNTATLCVAFVQAPATFQARNPRTLAPMPITFVPTFQHPGSTWGVTIDPPSVTLGGNDCPKDVKVTLTPPAGAPPGASEIVHVAAIGSGSLLGGVSVGRTAGPDGDHDLVWDGADNCPAAGNPAQADADHDSRGDACDCGPANPSVWAIPDEAGRIGASRDASAVQAVRLLWPTQSNQAGPGTTYDVLAGKLTELRNSGYAQAACLANDLTTNSFVDPQAVGVGSGVYYLVRAVNACGRGTWGDGSGLPDPRDPLEGATPCP
ncbi:MAG TPA: S8 family serine peptidase [Candidatus Polarisedimenticolaceae bacterium]|nr:S8 family serine peptidase [Candidatus Polarisedimenticolaceae bacterium]